MTTESTETKMTTDTSTTISKTGLQALLTPKNSVLLLIDHQPFQIANLHSHEPTMVVNNVIGLAKTAKVFGVPTIMTTVVEERGGFLIKGLQNVFPEQKLCLELPSSSEARGPVATARPSPNGITILRKSGQTPGSNSWISKTSTCRSSTSRCLP